MCKVENIYYISKIPILFVREIMQLIFVFPHFISALIFI